MGRKGNVVSLRTAAKAEGEKRRPGWAAHVRRLLPALLFGIAVGAGLALWLPKSNSLKGPVTHIRDGDTIEVSEVPVRLQGLNCDERGTPLGESATRAITALVRGEEVSCSLTGETTYDREVGHCSLPDGRDIGSVLIAQRQCGRCDRYDQSGAYVEIQSEAGPFAGAFPGYCKSN